MSGFTARSQATLLGSEFQDGQQRTISAQYLRDLAGTTVSTGAIMTSGSSITMSTNYLKIKKISGSPTAVTIPTPLVAWVNEFTVIDGKGDCATNPITLTVPFGIIDNAPTPAASIVMNNNGMSLTLVTDLVNWSLI